MFFNIDPSNGLAIYDQIVRQVKFSVANDAIPPGQMVPSVRELAKELAVNPNTVSRAYRELQSDGVLAAIRGTGLQVTSDAPANCRTERSELIRERLRSVLLEAKQGQIPPDEIRDIMDQELARIMQK